MSNATQVTTPVTNAFGSTIALGTIVRIAPTNNAATKAIANSAANVKGLLGVAQIGANNGVSFLAVLAGDAPVQLVTGLTLLNGDPIFVSDAQAGKGTNVAPSSNAKQVGYVKSTVGYSVNQQVTAVVTALGAAADAPPPPTPPTTLLQDYLGGEGADPLVLGEIVNVRGGNDFVERANATASVTFIGTIGVVAVATIGGGESGAIAVAGEAAVRLEAGLTPIAGQKIYVSATTAGRGTNVAPANVIPIGVIRSAANYVGSGTVYATITGIDQRPAAPTIPAGVLLFGSGVLTALDDNLIVFPPATDAHQFTNGGRIAACRMDTLYWRASVTTPGQIWGLSVTKGVGTTGLGTLAGTTGAGVFNGTIDLAFLDDFVDGEGVRFQMSPNGAPGQVGDLQIFVKGAWL